MKHRFAFVCLVGSITLFVGCGFPYRTLSSYTFGPAVALNKQCKEKNLSVAERSTADSLFALGEALYAEGKHKDALNLMDGAGIYYRMALAKDNLRQFGEQVATVQAKLGEAEQRLATYKKVLEQLQETGGEK
jgi:tetratricopeptide (TPR) repeat protein